MLGIVHNRVYIRWLEDLRMQVLADYLPLQPLMEAGLSPLLLKTSIQYKRPVRLFDPLVGAMWMSSLGRARYTLQAEFRVHDQVMAVAEQVGCFVEIATGRPVPLPKQVRDQW
jgi:acyl-CoA thioester hydrolase